MPDTSLSRLPRGKNLTTDARQSMLVTRPASKRTGFDWQQTVSAYSYHPACAIDPFRARKEKYWRLFLFIYVPQNPSEVTQHLRSLWTRQKARLAILKTVPSLATRQIAERLRHFVG